MVYIDPTKVFDLKILETTSVRLTDHVVSLRMKRRVILLFVKHYQSNSKVLCSFSFFMLSQVTFVLFFK